jgi:hypothetical protein
MAILCQKSFKSRIDLRKDESLGNVFIHEIFCRGDPVTKNQDYSKLACEIF